MKILKILVRLSMLILLSNGCSHIEPIRDSNGMLIKIQSFKTPLMGDLSFREKVKTTDTRTGIIIERETETSTSTNADKVINAGANFIKTGINEAEKAGALIP